MNHVKLDEIGPPCPRCKQRTEVRAHREITPKQLRQPFYYSRWFYCTNRQCNTNLIMPKEFMVMRGAAKAAPADNDFGDLWVG